MTNSGYQGELYMPLQFQTWLEQDIVHQTLTSMRVEQQKSDATNSDEVPIIENELFNPPSHSIDSREYEFDSLSDATYEKDVDTIHMYKNHLEIGERSRVRLNEFDSISVNTFSLWS